MGFDEEESILCVIKEVIKVDFERYSKEKEGDGNNNQ